MYILTTWHVHRVIVAHLVGKPHTCTCTHTHASMHTHTHTHVHTQTYTHTTCTYADIMP
jgi:hypothetical protein